MQSSMIVVEERDDQNQPEGDHGDVKNGGHGCGLQQVGTSTTLIPYLDVKQAHTPGGGPCAADKKGVVGEGNAGGEHPKQRPE